MPYMTQESPKQVFSVHMSVKGSKLRFPSFIKKCSHLIFLGLIFFGTRRRRDIKMLLCLLAFVQTSLV